MRAYYKDALAAAWMSKHFGMKYQIEDDGEYFDCPYADLNKLEAIYIHPNSLPLLEPMVGDVFETKGNRGVKGYRIIKHVLTDTIVYNSGSHYPKDGIAKIIQRQGISFMWPEFGE